jgi:hypothetical protein
MHDSRIADHCCPVKIVLRFLSRRCGIGMTKAFFGGGVGSLALACQDTTQRIVYNAASVFHSPSVIVS